MKYIAPLILIAVLLTIPLIGIEVFRAEFLFGTILPYVTLVTFITGFTYRIILWARSPVPFRIPTTAGQGKSLSFIKQDKLESPSTMLQVWGRMALETLAFRSLFRNTSAEMRQGPNLSYSSSKWLWLGSMAFHWALFVVLLRHYRFFLEPVPGVVQFLAYMDGMFQITLPTFYLSGAVAVLATLYLLFRRFFNTQIRYISLPQDYFPLYMLLAILITGGLMRYGLKTDVLKVKMLTQSLARFDFQTIQGISSLFYMHLFLVCVFGIYFPFSKLMHAPGVFLSPTRNLANNSREKRHINPVNPQIPIKAYEDYEEEFKEKMIKAGIPLDQD